MQKDARIKEYYLVLFVIIFDPQIFISLLNTLEASAMRILISGVSSPLYDILLPRSLKFEIFWSYNDFFFCLLIIVLNE